MDPHPRVLSVGSPHPPGVQSGPPPSCAQRGPPPPCGLSGAPPGGVWPRAWRSAAPWAAWCGARLLRVSQLVPGRVAVLVLTCGLFCVCACVLAASAFSVSFGSNTRYSLRFSSAPAGRPLRSSVSPPAPRPPSGPPAVLTSSLWVCLRDVPGAGPALSRCFSCAPEVCRGEGAAPSRPRCPAVHTPGGAGRAGACAAPCLC